MRVSGVCGVAVWPRLKNCRKVTVVIKQAAEVSRVDHDILKSSYLI
jgi:hypothetical protein